MEKLKQRLSLLTDQPQHTVQHPEADILDVLRTQGFRHITTDLRYRFGIPAGTKLTMDK